MRLPGSRLLQEWRLEADAVLDLDELLASCRESGLTGFVEMQFADGAGMALYHLGTPVRVFLRCGTLAWQGADALERLRGRLRQGRAHVSVRELPLDAAHLLRGAANRRRLAGGLGSPLDFHSLLHALEKAGHTGTLEVHGAAGDGLVLIVRGRVANTYWERPDGPAFEDRAARQELVKSLLHAPAHAFLSDFSADVAKSRHEEYVGRQSRLERRPAGGPLLGDARARAEAGLRDEALAELLAELPAALRVSLCDLLTGATLAQAGRGSDCPALGPLLERLPGLVRSLHEALLGCDEVETLEIATGRLTAVVVNLPESREALVAVAEKAVPAARLAAALVRVAHRYALRMAPPTQARPPAGEPPQPALAFGR